MRPRRLKVEFYDTEGVRHSISIDGPVTRQKVAKVLDLVELMAGTNQTLPSALGLSQRKFDRLTSMVISSFKDRGFTSGDVKKTFEALFEERIPISTVSTYLTRLVDRGVLQRNEEKRELVYRVRVEERQPLALGSSARAS